MGTWTTIERPGYLGKYRDKKRAEWDAKYGQGNWRLAWKIGETCADYLGACALYEDAYFAFMLANPDIVEQLVSEASDVFDDAPTNVGSAFDYAKQETSRTHVQDISIRRCLLRLGIWFRGKDLIQIRHDVGSHPLSMTLSPGIVRFHRPDLIEPPLEPGRKQWYFPESTEAFYQCNKYLQTRT